MLTCKKFYNISALWVCWEKIVLKVLKTVIVALNKINRAKCIMPIDFQFLARGQNPDR